MKGIKTDNCIIISFTHKETSILNASGKLTGEMHIRNTESYFLSKDHELELLIHSTSDLVNFEAINDSMGNEYYSGANGLIEFYDKDKRVVIRICDKIDSENHFVVNMLTMREIDLGLKYRVLLWNIENEIKHE